VRIFSGTVAQAFLLEILMRNACFLAPNTDYINRNLEGYATLCRKNKKSKILHREKEYFFQLLHIVDEFADDCFQVNLALLGKIVKPAGFNLG